MFQKSLATCLQAGDPGRLPLALQQAGPGGLGSIVLTLVTPISKVGQESRAKASLQAALREKRNLSKGLKEEGSERHMEKIE
jgi:hypothetical protein